MSQRAPLLNAPRPADNFNRLLILAHATRSSAKSEEVSISQVSNSVVID
jgi:hypothetical protein